jgi:hypothetical protein
MNKPTASIFKDIPTKDSSVGAKGSMAAVKKVAAGSGKPESDPTKVESGWATDYTKDPKHT